MRHKKFRITAETSLGQSKCHTLTSHPVTPEYDPVCESRRQKSPEFADEGVLTPNPWGVFYVTLHNE